MTGAPRSAYASSEFIQVRLEAVDALGSWEAAGVWQRICWRSERTGCWVATVAQIADEVHLSEHKTKGALAAARDAGWVTSERASGRDRTLSWMPVWLEGISTSPSGESRHMVEAESAATSLQTVETLETPPVAPQAAEVVQGELVPLPLSLVPALVAQPVEDDQPPVSDPRWWAFWWEHWPRKVSKRDAEKAWAKAVRSGVHPLVMLRGLADQLPTLRARPKYCPYPASWINGAKWEDTVADLDPVDLRAWRGNPFAHPDVVAAAEQMPATMFGAVR